MYELFVLVYQDVVSFHYVNQPVHLVYNTLLYLNYAMPWQW